MAGHGALVAAAAVLTMRILEADFLLAEAGAKIIADGAVVVSDGTIRALGSTCDIVQRFPDARRQRLNNALLLPGFVNAHQHGRGLSQIQLGYPDDALEPWIARRRGRGGPDSYALTRLAAEEMLANGVTSTLHANYSYSTGDYEAELRGVLRAYQDAGLRATVCIGYADRGGVIYPSKDEAEFRAALSPEAQMLLAAPRPAYLPLDDTLRLMARLVDEFSGHPTITLACGPAGPQWVSDEAWRRLAGDAAKRGIGIHFHLLESPAQERCAGTLYPEGVLRRLESLGVFETRASAAHFTQAAMRDVEDAVRLGLVIVANPGSNMRLYNGPPPIASWRRAGLSVAVGTDNCALDDNEDYLSELRLAGLLGRFDEGGRAYDGVSSALRMGTSAGALATFNPQVGCLDVGMRADLIALDLSRISGSYLDADADILEAVLARGKGADVLLTLVDGVERYSRGANERRRDAANMAAATVMSARSIGDTARHASEELAEALRSHYRGASA